MLLHAMHRARDVGATHATVACVGAPGLTAARHLYYSVGFRPISQDAPVFKAGKDVVQPAKDVIKPAKDVVEPGKDVIKPGRE
jgi:hypothetical protein